MNKINFDKKMTDILSSFNGKKPSLLLHSCCAPCSSACLQRLFPFFDVTVLYYNPNISGEEYFKRKAEQQRLLKETGWAHFLDCDHDEESFYLAVQGLENEPEGGKRCEACFALRLEKTAQVAKAESFDYFATTLTVSPLKNAETINKLGEQIAKEYHVEWLYSDFKKQNGYLNSIKLSEKHNLYRQNYCGCVFSEKAISKKG